MGVGGCSLDDPLLGVEGGQGVQAQPVHHLEEGLVTGVPLEPRSHPCHLWGCSPALVWSLQGHSCHTHTPTPTSSPADRSPLRQVPCRALDSTHCTAPGRPGPSVTRPPHSRACAGKGPRQLPPGQGSSSWESVALVVKGPELREQPSYNPRCVTKSEVYPTSKQSWK